MHVRLPTTLHYRHLLVLIVVIGMGSTTLTERMYGSPKVPDVLITREARAFSAKKCECGRSLWCHERRHAANDSRKIWGSVHYAR